MITAEDHMYHIVLI